MDSCSSDRAVLRDPEAAEQGPVDRGVRPVAGALDHLCVECGFSGWLRCTFVARSMGLVCNQCAGTLTERTMPLLDGRRQVRRCDNCEWCGETTQLHALCTRPETMAGGWNLRGSTCEEHAFKTASGCSHTARSDGAKE